VSLVAIQCR